MASSSALVCGTRPVLRAVLACSVIWGCVEDTGELFPELALPASSAPVPVEAPSAEARPDDGAALGEGVGVDGEVSPTSAAAAGESAEPEQPSPVELDATSTDGVNGATSEPPTPTPTPGGDGEPPSDEAASTPAAEAAPEDAPQPVVGDAAEGPTVCAGVADPLLLDFTSPGSDDPTQALFGDFQEVLSGGTYVYPNVGEGALQAPGLRSDVTSGDWHISGSVTQQAGFGLFLDCQLLDASRFTGLAFRISGNVQGADSITLLIGTASNDVSPAWLVSNDVTSSPGSGRCTPAQDPYDGTCNTARVEIPVSLESREVLVPFSALGQGSPERGVNPAELTTIAWALPPPAVDGSGQASAYDVDLRIDDIRFIERSAQLP